MSAIANPATGPDVRGHPSPRPETPRGEPQTCATSELDGQILFNYVANVREIPDLQPIVTLPCAPAAHPGRINVGGEGIAAVDLPSRLGMRGSGGQHGRILVLEPRGTRRAPVGFTANRDLNVVAFARDKVETAPETPVRRDAAALRGVACVPGRHTLLLEPDAMLGGPVPGGFEVPA